MNIVEGEWSLSPWAIVEIVFAIYVIAVLIFTAYGIWLKWDQIAFDITQICIGGACP